MISSFCAPKLPVRCRPIAVIPTTRSGLTASGQFLTFSRISDAWPTELLPWRQVTSLAAKGGCQHAKEQSVVGPSKPRLLGALGPGLITGASDDDPSGIATYSQAGAQFGFGLTWTLLFSYPLMSVVQEISAGIGRTTGQGIAGNMRRYYPNWLLQWATP